MTDPGGDHPLILTLRLDAERQVKFDALRKAHFPPERNHLAAHVTLFHQLPGAVQQELSDVSSDFTKERPAPEVTVERVVSLGRGVAFRLASPEVIEIRRAIAQRFRPHLTRQDQNFGHLHVTVQNKVTSTAARDLLERLQANFVAECFASPGLDLWRYLDGPWGHVAQFDFADWNHTTHRSRPRG